jgi:hypothetical protein
VQLVDIVGKWDNAHKTLEGLQAQFDLIRCNLQSEFEKASVARDTILFDLQNRFEFFSNVIAASISNSLKDIEECLKPLIHADLSAE